MARTPAADMPPANVTMANVNELLLSPLLPLTALLKRPWSRAVTAESIKSGMVARTEKVRASFDS